MGNAEGTIMNRQIYDESDVYREFIADIVVVSVVFCMAIGFDLWAIWKMLT